MGQDSVAKFDIPDHMHRGSPLQKQLMSPQDSGLELLELMRERLGLDDFANVSILDVGCGGRITQAILGKGLAVGRYVGLDVYRELIEYLQLKVRDPRLQYFKLNFYNRAYNPAGELLTLDSRLPVEGRFDVICLFSVFTHLDPRDSDCMLAMLRRYLAERGRLIFTCFLNDSVSGFDDVIPERPLEQAHYSEAMFRHLLGRNGWTVEALYLPTMSPAGYWLMQHCFVCSAR